MRNDNLGDRMKTYENVTRTYLTRRTPVIIRIDGKAFHTFTRGFDKPFDDVLVKAMQQTMKYLCETLRAVCLAIHSQMKSHLFFVTIRNLPLRRGLITIYRRYVAFQQVWQL